MNRTTICISNAAHKRQPTTSQQLLGKRTFAQTAKVQIISNLRRGSTILSIPVIASFGEISASTLPPPPPSESDLSDDPSYISEPAIQKKLMVAGVSAARTQYSTTPNTRQQREFYFQYKTLLSEAKTFNMFNSLTESDQSLETCFLPNLAEKHSVWSASIATFEPTALSVPATPTNNSNKTAYGTSTQITTPSNAATGAVNSSNQGLKCDEKKRLWIAESMSRCTPFDNYINQFIFHKKYKDFETEEQKYQGVSRFHNLNRMFMHNIIKILSRENLDQFDIPFAILTKISTMVHDIKAEAFKKYNHGKSKTCFFNHYHYNLLFLRITPYTLKIFAASQKDLELHQNIIGVSFQQTDFNAPSVQQDIEYANLLKAYIFAIVETTINANIRAGNYENCVRLQYVYRVLQGIQKLSEGSPIKRF